MKMILYVFFLIASFLAKPHHDGAINEMDIPESISKSYIHSLLHQSTTDVNLDMIQKSFKWCVMYEEWSLMNEIKGRFQIHSNTLMDCLNYSIEHQNFNQFYMFLNQRFSLVDQLSQSNILTLVTSAMSKEDKKFLLAFLRALSAPNRMTGDTIDQIWIQSSHDIHNFMQVRSIPFFVSEISNGLVQEFLFTLKEDSAVYQYIWTDSAFIEFLTKNARMDFLKKTIVNTDYVKLEEIVHCLKFFDGFSQRLILNTWKSTIYLNDLHAFSLFLKLDRPLKSNMAKELFDAALKSDNIHFLKLLFADRHFMSDIDLSLILKRIQGDSMLKILETMGPLNEFSPKILRMISFRKDYENMLEKLYQKKAVHPSFETFYIFDTIIKYSTHSTNRNKFSIWNHVFTQSNIVSHLHV